MTLIVPAILTTDENELVEKLRIIENFCNRVQIDVMDGKFVPFESTAGNGLDSPIHLEAHLMVEEPNVAEFSNFDTIIVHAEACKESHRIISQIKALDREIGLAINPQTTVEQIREFIPEIDLIMVMTVHPGKQGQSFLPEMLKKVKQLKEEFPDLKVEVDGGVDDSNIKQVIEAGADVIAVGHYITLAKNMEKQYEFLSSLK